MTKVGGWVVFSKSTNGVVGCDLLFRKNHRLSTSLGDGGSNAIQVTLTIDGDLASTINSKK